MTDHNNALKLGFDPGAGVDGEGAYPDWLSSAPYARMLPTKVLPPGTAAAAVSTEAGLARLGGGGARPVKVVAGTTDSVAAFVAARCTQPVGRAQGCEFGRPLGLAKSTWFSKVFRRVNEND